MVAQVQAPAAMISWESDSFANAMGADGSIGRSLRTCEMKLARLK